MAKVGAKVVDGVQLQLIMSSFVTHFMVFSLGMVIGMSFNFYGTPFSGSTSSTTFQVISQSQLPVISPAPESTTVVPRMRKMSIPDQTKVAFMFLSRGPLPMGPLWERFFNGNDGLYSIYVHSNPSFTATHHPNSVFYGRTIPSKEVEWGQPSMMQAERRLLANALLDFSNQRFVLLSESCIPVFNFTTIYTYLMDSPQIFVEAYDSPGRLSRRRYRRKMNPTITEAQWRKGSQWFEMDRRTAIDVVADQKYFPLFEKHCHRNCITDEHYLPTMLRIRFSQRNANRTLTWTDWSKRGPHPAGFDSGRVTVGLLERIRSGSTCEYNGEKTRICHLFARKFMASALDRLLEIAPQVMFIH